MKKFNIKGVEWTYTTGGEGARALLMFHEAVGGAEGVGWLGEAFSSECRTIAPTIADVRRIEEVCDAASAILDREHVGRATVFGGSFGGALAQAFAKRYPRQVERLILLTTCAPDPALGTKHEKQLRVMSRLPFALTRAFVKMDVMRHLDAPVPPEASERVRLVKEHLKNYFDNVLTKDVMLSRMALSVDFCRHEPDAFAVGADWAGRVLIVESKHDNANHEEARARLRAAYPGALVCTFADAGEMIPLLRQDALIEVIRAFMREEYARPEDLEQGCSHHDDEVETASHSTTATT